MPYPLLGPVVEPFCLPKNKGDIFEDSFDAEANGKTLPSGWLQASPGFYLSEGLIRTPDDLNSIGRIYTPTKYKNVSVSAEYVRYTNASRYVSILARFNYASNNGYQFVWHYANGVYINKIVGGITSSLLSTGVSVGDFGTVKCECIGSLLRIYVRDKLLGEVIDSTYPDEGSIGIQVRAGGFKWFKAGRL